MPVLGIAQSRSERGGGSALERRLVGAKEVPIDQVVPDPAQPRRDWVQADGTRRLEELAGSIREFGLLQPVLVFEDGTIDDGRPCYRIIAGARRRIASERAGLTMIPVVVREASGRLRYLQLQENVQRQDLAPLDEARAFQELLDLGRHEDEGLTAQSLAARLSISGQHVRDRLRLLTDQVLADAVERRQISASAAREIMKLPDEEIPAFRERVRRGEHLQTNDVATARARLAAAGVVNVRRKGPIALASVPEDRVPATYSGIVADQTLFDPQHNGNTAVPPATKSAVTPRETPTETVATRNGRGTREHESRIHAVQSPGERIEALLADQPGESHLLVDRLLAIGVEQEWSCAELQRYIHGERT